MNRKHANVELLGRLDPANMARSSDIFADDVVFHYFNPRLPDLAGDYVGHAGLGEFFGKVAAMSDGTFKINPVATTPIGDELVVTQTRNTMSKQGEDIDIDVVVVWRFVDGRITEVWDIPSVYTKATGEIGLPIQHGGAAGAVGS